MSRLTAFLVLLTFHSLVGTGQSINVCEQPFCECAPAIHPSWTVVNCTVPRGQNLDFFEGDLPDSTTDLIIFGGEAVTFGANSLTRLKDARHIRISGAQLVLMRKFAAPNLNIVSMYLEIDNCAIVRIEERTFTNIKGPLSVTLSDCDYIGIEGEAFSWLLTVAITNIRQISLNAQSFMLDHTAANVGEHGPGMTIQLKNAKISEFAKQTFGSSAASIILDSVNVAVIRSGAFSANTYNSITAINCTFDLFEGESFAQKSLINNLQFLGCNITQLSAKSLQSAVGNLNISQCRFDNIETGSINATVASVAILDNVFHVFMEKGFELSSWNNFQMKRNSFDKLAPYAIIAPGASIHELIFSENEIETPDPNSLSFINQAYEGSQQVAVYENNYFGQPCHCNISIWIANVLGSKSSDPYESESFCTVGEFFARCFNVPEQNMQMKKFLDGVCTETPTIQCEEYKSDAEGSGTEIKNPRFPHKNKAEGGLSDRNKKVIGIVIVTTLGCIIIALFITLIRWMKRKGYCVNVKNFLISSNSSCGLLCDRFCSCGANNGLDNARSISQLSVNEYSERHRLNEPRIHEVMQETTLPDMYTEQVVPTDDKTTQTLPEELTKELLENLKEKLEDPENYVEAREMIEHLYELIKVEENCNSNEHVMTNRQEENIYELPFQNTAPRIGKNKKQMISVGTRTPSLDKLLPLSPYNRQTALAHEYFEPKDYAVHLYAEIANNEKERKTLMNAMPDIVLEQVAPRGPYLRAVREKINFPLMKTKNTSFDSPQDSSSHSKNSTMSNSSHKMVNRPLPKKPNTVLDPGEGTSYSQR